MVAVPVEGMAVVAVVAEQVLAVAVQGLHFLVTVGQLRIELPTGVYE